MEHGNSQVMAFIQNKIKTLLFSHHLQRYNETQAFHTLLIVVQTCSVSNFICIFEHIYSHFKCTSSLT